MILLFGLESFLEWKYLNNSKQYITSIIFLILSVVIIYNIDYFFYLLE